MKKGCIICSERYEFKEGKSKDIDKTEGSEILMIENYCKECNESTYLDEGEYKNKKEDKCLNY